MKINKTSMLRSYLESKAIAKCWHGSAPTPGTQMVEELAVLAATWLEAWDTLPRNGAVYEIGGKDWQWVDGELCEA